MILQLQDDDMNKHLPWHFYAYLSDGDIIHGTYSGPTFKNHILEKSIEISAFPRRGKLDQYFCVFLFLMNFVFKRHHIRHVIVYDDIIKLLLCWVFFPQEKLILRITHLKWRERFASCAICSGLYELMFKFILRRKIKKVMMSSAMKAHFDAPSYQNLYVVESCIQKIHLEKPNRIPAVVYAGTVSKNRYIENLLHEAANICKEASVKFVIFAIGEAAEIEAIEMKLTGFNAKIYKNLSDDEYQRELGLYRGIGLSPYFVEDNPVLEFNSPLKTLDYLSRNFKVLGSEISAHRDLARLMGGQVLTLFRNENFALVLKRELKFIDTKVDCAALLQHRGQEYCQSEWKSVLND